MVAVFTAKELKERFKKNLLVPIPIEVIMMFIMSILAFAVAFAVAKVYAVKHDYVIDGNQVSSTISSKVYAVKHDYVIDGNQESSTISSKALKKMDSK
ncbi:uncharacterized [Tachysurus ichikawai]